MPAQSVRIITDGALHDTNAMLDTSSITTGLHKPHMNSTQRDQIAFPSNGGGSASQLRSTSKKMTLKIIEVVERTVTELSHQNACKKVAVAETTSVVSFN